MAHDNTKTVEITVEEKPKTKSYALSKTKVRDMLTEKFGKEGVDNAKVKVTLADVLGLFEGRSAGAGDSDVMVYKDNELVGKRCSYFGLYFPIAEFGKRGETVAFQCKAAEAIVRKQRTDAIKAKAVNDERLDSGEATVEEWKSANKSIEESKSVKQPYTGKTTGYETAEELLAHL